MNAPAAYAFVPQVLEALDQDAQELVVLVGSAERADVAFDDLRRCADDKVKSRTGFRTLRRGSSLVSVVSAKCEVARYGRAPTGLWYDPDVARDGGASTLHYLLQAAAKRDATVFELRWDT